MLGVVHGAGRGSKMENVVHGTQVEWQIDITPDEFKAWLIRKVGDVVQAPRNQVVHAHHVVAAAEKCIAQMGSNETGAAGDQCSHKISPCLQVKSVFGNWYSVIVQARTTCIRWPNAPTQNQKQKPNCQKPKN